MKPRKQQQQQTQAEVEAQLQGIQGGSGQHQQGATASASGDADAGGLKKVRVMEICAGVWTQGCEGCKHLHQNCSEMLASVR
eukprot:1153521-Pelagomonas_calceolata.AAC.6